MKKLILFLCFIIVSSVFAAPQDPIYGQALIENISTYNKVGELFTDLQHKYFTIGFLIVALGVPLVFVIHYLIIGPKKFSHDGKKIYVFSLFKRIIHWIAAISFVVIVPTGFIMAFGDFFGGGAFVRISKELHAISTIFVIISVIPMTLFWLKEMLPTSDDIKWLMIVGGYLSKEKKPIPAGKFNAGQKMWFWLCTFGGMIMVITGGIMYFQDFKFEFLDGIISQINLLRGSAIVHNILGMLVAALFMVHIYMSIFAIKGAIQSMISGYKEEEEIEILHSTYYKELKEKNEI